MPKIFVTAKPNSKKPGITLLPDLYSPAGEVHCVVAVNEPPKEGKANAAIARALAEHFGVSVSAVKLISGASAKKKVFVI